MDSVSNIMTDYHNLCRRGKRETSELSEMFMQFALNIGPSSERWRPRLERQKNQVNQKESELLGKLKTMQLSPRHATELRDFALECQRALQQEQHEFDSAKSAAESEHRDYDTIREFLNRFQDDVFGFAKALAQCHGSTTINARAATDLTERLARCFSEKIARIEKAVDVCQRKLEHIHARYKNAVIHEIRQRPSTAEKIRPRTIVPRCGHMLTVINEYRNSRGQSLSMEPAVERIRKRFTSVGAPAEKLQMRLVNNLRVELVALRQEFCGRLHQLQQMVDKCAIQLVKLLDKRMDSLLANPPQHHKPSISQNSSLPAKIRDPKVIVMPDKLPCIHALLQCLFASRKFIETNTAFVEAVASGSLHRLLNDLIRNYAACTVRVDPQVFVDALWEKAVVLQCKGTSVSALRVLETIINKLTIVEEKALFASENMKYMQRLFGLTVLKKYKCGNPDCHNIRCGESIAYIHTLTIGPGDKCKLTALYNETFASDEDEQHLLPFVRYMPGVLKNMQDALDACMKPVVVDYDCASCGLRTRAVQRTYFVESPQVLIIHVVRLKKEPSTCWPAVFDRYKAIDLTDFTTSNDEQNKVERKYQLYAMMDRTRLLQCDQYSCFFQYRHRGWFHDPGDGKLLGVELPTEHPSEGKASSQYSIPEYLLFYKKV